ncbi:chromosome segregation protein SMC [Haematobacter missouriensis]|uniref:Chromosome partition protein Smc n=1 Tax=Haematobacter missouriensis TaxID=366616 RepID=A0A212AVN3_9RHOB|nr:AAA family ATPase [Haematobacter missouriensis]KFI33611.1 chromosome segregation protein SMC [Haematobacter missouriensis]OWJ79275.1 chromosome segregation protein SMC [Haematobacter missouriensis]OWJ85547.1 chromosome segregation protein SMC [Haematobacter missouriensis]
MRFVRLRLNGFKSFVDPTDLVIAEGLTGVVGPNGCGKSNLLEALRWVMGETRPSAMRGGGMEDVIFAGAASRSARGFAEVALSIDNSERLAPPAFNDTDALDIVRRITRDQGSAYRVNGKDVRARDVQMLFADASTGAHSPALVRQGQIAELINARPQARRRILEEAAGISGLYQRRHEAELRLSATTQNLERVDDMLEQFLQQMRMLEKQARQAARYREIGAALRRAEGALLLARWQEAVAAAEVARTGAEQASRKAAETGVAAEEAAALRTDLAAEIPGLREEASIATAVVERLRLQQAALAEEEARAGEAVAALRARADQLAADREREAALHRDAGETLRRLEEEAHALLQAGEGHEERLEEAEESAETAAAVLAEAEARLVGLTETLARAVADHESGQRRLSAAETVAERSLRDAARASAQAEEAEQLRARAVEAVEAAAEGQEAGACALEIAEEAIIAAETRLRRVQGEEGEARTQRTAAEAVVRAISAEVTTLGRMVEQARGKSSRVLDQVAVSAGYEKALGAALADDLDLPERESDGSGWRHLPPLREDRLPEGVEPLARHVDGPLALARRLSRIGVATADRAAALLPALMPGVRLVTREGDLFRWDGLVRVAGDGVSDAARQLAQRNRLATLRVELAEAEARAETLREGHEALADALAAAAVAEKSARMARKEAEQRLAEASRALNRAETERSVAEGRMETTRLAAHGHREQAERAAEEVEEARVAMAAFPPLDGLREDAAAARRAVEQARATTLHRRAATEDIRRQGAARERRAAEVSREQARWAERLSAAEGRAREMDGREAAVATDLARARAVPEALAARAEALAADLDLAGAREARARPALQSAERALAEAEAAERAAERLASDNREERASAIARADAAALVGAEAADRIREEAETEPAALAASLGEVTVTAGETEEEIHRLRRAREALGAVNLRAEEDARALAEEQGTLAVERADLDAAVTKLRAGIAALNREGRERLLAAFDQVNRNFRQLFTHLFGGGEADLVMVESDDPLEAGLEIMCQPPGKKLSVLSLLSGGEQTLTAMALIFAVFLANPAPICVLDEVDAPLDDANVGRFCDLLDEMTRRTGTRFLVITHHAVTMARMDRLFGVTMQEQGVSQLVSVDLTRAEALVA